MATHYKFYDGLQETIVPWQAEYDFPSQANKAQKVTSRITPSSGTQVYGPGTTIRINIPAQGYMNCLNSTLEFDLTLVAPNPIGTSITRIENNIQSIFSRGRILYGSLPFEDIINQNLIVRALTEWTDGGSTLDQDSISNGIGGVVMGAINNGSYAGVGTSGLVNVRQAYVQGIDASVDGFGFVPNQSAGQTTGLTTQTYAQPGTSDSVALAVCTRRYQINLPFGLMLQDKLMPMKWMASQFQIELFLAPPAQCLFMIPSVPFVDGVQTYTSGALAGGSDANYAVSNINLITEILEFDASYDAGFYEGLQADGCPLHYASWHNFTLPITSSQLNVIIQEKARSIKGIVAFQQRQPSVMTADSNATFFDTSSSPANTPGATSTGTLQSYQFRAGSRWYPSQPVQCSVGIGSSVPNGGCEAFVELQKFLNTLGDSRVKTSNNTLRWALPSINANAVLTTDAGLPGVGVAVNPSSYATSVPYPSTSLNELDYGGYVVGFNQNGIPRRPVVAEYSGTNSGGNLAPKPLAGNVGSSCFAMAVSLETSNGNFYLV